MTTLSTVDVLVLDDFALEPMGRDESRDIYQLFVERNGRFCTIVTIDQEKYSKSNKIFASVLATDY